jgi:hypothetical protein
MPALSALPHSLAAELFSIRLGRLNKGMCS